MERIVKTERRYKMCGNIQMEIQSTHSLALFYVYMYIMWIQIPIKHCMHMSPIEIPFLHPGNSWKTFFSFTFQL